MKNNFAYITREGSDLPFIERELKENENQARSLGISVNPYGCKNVGGVRKNEKLRVTFLYSCRSDDEAKNLKKLLES